MLLQISDWYSTTKVKLLWKHNSIYDTTMWGWLSLMLLFRCVCVCAPSYNILLVG